MSSEPSNDADLTHVTSQPASEEPRLRATYLRDWVYGGIDGTVTTFAVAAGAAGADLSTAVVLVLGCANLVADGFSMAAANFSGTTAEVENYARLIADERLSIAREPERTREKIRQSFARQGFQDDDLERLVQTALKDEPALARTFVLEEHGQIPISRSPFIAALCTFAAFVVFGTIPLLPYLFEGEFPLSAAATLVAFFIIGSVKSRWSLRSAWSLGLETLAIGATAAALAFLIGSLLGGFTVN